MKKVLLIPLLPLLLLFFNSVRAKENLFYSLTHALKNSKNDKRKLSVLIELSNACPEEDILKYAQPAADKVNNPDYAIMLVNSTSQSL